MVTLSHAADTESISRILRVNPVWRKMRSAGDAVNLADTTLLHAGPAFSDPTEIVRPVLNSAKVALVFNGAAQDFDEAEHLILSGAITLEPAQDYDVVTPLAAVVSSKMLLHCIEDDSDANVRSFSPINGGNGPAPRLGTCSKAALEHLTWLHDSLGPALSQVCDDGITLLDIAAGSLLEGDDCHGRTPVGTRLLLEKIRPRLQVQPRVEKYLSFIEDSPSFFLNLWMAASKAILLGARGTPDSSLIITAAANGRETGIQVAGLPGQWFTAPASPPHGAFDVDLPPSRALGAIGDSAIVDILGFGAMAISFSNAQQKNLGHFLPQDGLSTGALLTSSPHPAFAELGLRVGLTAREWLASNRQPLVSLGILDNSGEVGRLGGGIFEQPRSLAADCMEALATNA